MEKVRTEEIVKKQKAIEFYCDGCGVKLGESVEYDDGYVEQLGEFECSVLIDEWYKIKKCFCDKCKQEFLDEYIKIIKELGFEKEND